MAAQRPKKAPIGNPEYAEPLVGALLAFLTTAGMERKAILSMVESSLDSLESPIDSADLRGLDRATISAVGAAFHRWFREPEFLTNEGKPRPLSLHGGTLSVQGLLQSELPEGVAHATAAELPRIHLLRKVAGGRFLPTSLHSLIRHNHPYLNEHIAHSIVRFLHTVKDNVATAGSSPPLIERFAYVSEIPKSLEREFKDFTNQQGEALIDTVNDWLESKRIKNEKTGSTASLQAGLHVFAFIAENDSPK